MTAQSDLRDAMIEAIKDELLRQHKVNYDGCIVEGEMSDAILSLLARWECKEPGDCPE